MANMYSRIRASSSLIKRFKHGVTTTGNPLLWQSRILARSFTTTEGHRPSIVHKRSLDILHDPWFNKVRLLFRFLANFWFRFFGNWIFFFFLLRCACFAGWLIGLFLSFFTEILVFFLAPEWSLWCSCSFFKVMLIHLFAFREQLSRWRNEIVSISGDFFLQMLCLPSSK